MKHKLWEYLDFEKEKKELYKQKLAEIYYLNKKIIDSGDY